MNKRKFVSTLVCVVSLIPAISYSQAVVRYPGQKLIETQNVTYNLLWNYSADDIINAVSIPADGSYIVAGSRNKKIYFLQEMEILYGVMK